MYRIKLMRKANKYREFDEIIEIEDKNEAQIAYWGYMKKPYYFGSFVKVVNGREENRASFCNSEFA